MSKLLYTLLLFLVPSIQSMEDDKSSLLEFKEALCCYQASTKDEVEIAILASLYVNLPMPFRKKAHRLCQKNFLSSDIFPLPETTHTATINRKDLLGTLNRDIEVYEAHQSLENFLIFLATSAQVVDEIPDTVIHKRIRFYIKNYRKRLIAMTQHDRSKQRLELIKQKKEQLRKMHAQENLRKSREVKQIEKKRRYSWPCFVKSDNL